MKLRSVLLIIFLFFGIANCFSQNYFLRNYGLEDGLSHNALHDIIQAKDNSLWITSFYGVMQFDGKKFKTYTTDDGLCSNQIRNVFEDSKGRIWVGSWRFKGISIIDKGRVYTPTDTILKRKEVMTAAYEDSLGVIWLFGTTSIIKCTDDKFESVYHSPGPAEFSHVNGVVTLNNNQLIAPTLNSGVAKINLYPFSIEFINSESDGINNTCYSVFKDRNNIIWVGHYGGFFSLKEGVIKKYTLPGDSNKNRVWSIDEDKNGYLWMALYGGGFVRWDKNEEYIFVNEKNGLNDPYCYKLLVDNENNKWITTDQGGLVKFKNFSFKYYKKEHGLPSNFITDIIENKNEIVCSSENGLVFFEADTIKCKILANKSINAIGYDTENTLWLATQSGYGTYKNEALKLYFENDIFYDVAIDKCVVIGGQTQVIIDNKLAVEIKNLNVRTSETYGESIIIGTTGGSFLVTGNEISRVPGLHPADFNTAISSLKIAENEFLLGNPEELVYLKKTETDNIIKKYARKEFGNLKSFNALFLKENNLWIASDNALSKVDLKMLLEKDSVVMTVVDEFSGFIDGQSNPNGILVDKKGDVWIATTNGLMKYAENLNEENKKLPKLKITSVKLFSELFSDSLYDKNGELEFPHNKNHFTFEYSAISLTHPDKIKYKYRLLGLQDEWSATSSENKAVYSYLPPGNYQFEFIASNGSGYWEKEPSVYKFNIRAPFWDTIWFNLLLIMATLLLIGFIFSRYRKTIKRKQLEQETFTRNIIRGQEEERKRVSKELHDGIGQKLLLINNAIIQNKNEELPDLVNNTIDEIRSIARNLHPFQLERFGITLALETMVKDIEASGSSIFFSEEIENIDGLLSKENEVNLYRIFQECINNIFKHAQATSAKLTVEKRKDALYVEIRDNGVGFNLNKGENSFYSLGLKSIQERVKILNGEIIFKSEKGIGTKIVIYIHL